MRLVFIIRLYSGFVSSIEDRVWRPSGVPTIYKLVDSAQSKREHDITIVLSRKSAGDAAADMRGLRIDGLNADIDVLAGPARIPRVFGPLRWYLGELRQAWLAWLLCRRENPDIVYVDRGNLWTAAVLARLGRRTVVYRMMGISPGVRRSLSSWHPRQLFHRWFLRSPFAHVICSQDGSGGEFWLDRLLAPAVDRTMLLNGVDIDAPAPASGAARPPDGDGTRTLVSFVGRLETDKGCEEFMHAFLTAWRKDPDRLYALVIGDGSCRDRLRDMVMQAGAGGHVEFTGALPHAQALARLHEADIYVSVNKMGNLSNANLEALRLGLCCVFPSGDPTTGRDVVTDSLFPADDTVYRVDLARLDQDLPAAIFELHRDADKRQARAAATAAAARKIIPTWDQRIEAEWEILTPLSCPPADMAADCA